MSSIVTGASPQDGMLRDCVDRLSADFHILSPGVLHRRLAEVRALASEMGWAPLVALARRFEEAVAEGGHAIIGRPLVEAMRDAAQLGEGDHAASQAYLASVNLRLIG
jgi:hypothetical protein